MGCAGLDLALARAANGLSVVGALDHVVVEITGDAGVGEDCLGFSEDLFLAVAARYVRQEEPLDAGFAGELRSLSGGQVAEFGGKILLNR